MTEPDHGGLDPQDDARICNGRTDLVIDWVNAGNDATKSVGDGRRLIQVCAYFGDVTAISFLLARGEKLDSLGPDLGLNGAVFHGHWRLTEFLLSRGADANAPDEATGETPLHSVFGAAYRAEHDLVLEVLLAFGARPDVTTRPGVPTGAFMRDVRTRAETPLHRAAAFASERAITRLLAAGADLSARDVNGDSPLAWASWHRRDVPVLKLLSPADGSLYPGKPMMAENLRGQPRRVPEKSGTQRRR